MSERSVALQQVQSYANTANDWRIAMLRNFPNVGTQTDPYEFQIFKARQAAHHGSYRPIPVFLLTTNRTVPRGTVN